MRFRTLTARVVLVLVLVLSAAPSAWAQVAKFSKVRDAVPSKFFDATTTEVNPADGNQLIIGFNSDVDPESFTSTEFRASTLPFTNRSAADTVAFTVTAPDGYFVSKITYSQSGTGSASRTAVQSGTAEWVVAGFPHNLGVFGRNPNLVGTAHLKRRHLRTVRVSITVSLFAAGTGNLSVNAADVLVELEPLPE